MSNQRGVEMTQDGHSPDQLSDIDSLIAAAPVYLDGMGHLWSADREALHALAARIGMRRAWFQERPRLYHYDVLSRAKRAQAYRLGVIGVSPRRLVALIRENDAALERNPR